MSRLARHQIGLLHSAPASLGIAEADRRTLQRTLGGAESAAEMDLAGCARCLAFYERAGWREPRRAGNHWRRMAERAELLPRENKAMKLASVLDWNAPDGRLDFLRVGGFVRRMTGKASLRDCSASELDVVIEALKAMLARTRKEARA